MKLMILVLALSLTHTVNAQVADDDDVTPATPPTAASTAPSGPAILNIDFDLADVGVRPFSDRVKESVREYLRQHPECQQQVGRYCPAVMPSSGSSGGHECGDGLTVVSEENYALFVDSRKSPPRPRGMSGTQLEDIIPHSRARAFTGGVCLPTNLFGG